MLGISRKFIPKFSEIAEPLFRLLRKNVKFDWTSEQEDLFRKLIDKMCSKPILQLYNANAETELHTDASSKGLGAMLLQKGLDDKFHMVYAISRRTNDCEKFYHSSK